MELNKQMFLNFNEKGRKYEKGVYHCSEIPMCHRRIYFKRAFPDIDNKCNEKMAMGKIMHHVIPEIVGFVHGNKENNPLQFEVELESPAYVCREFSGAGKFFIRGTADAIDDKRVYEFKFSSLDRVTMAALTQANLYCGISGREDSTIFMINSGYYDDSKLLDVKRFDQKFNEQHFKMILDNLCETHRLIMSDNPDIAEFPHSPSFEKECSMCPFREKCLEYTGLP